MSSVKKATSVAKPKMVAREPESSEHDDSNDEEEGEDLSDEFNDSGDEEGDESQDGDDNDDEEADDEPVVEGKTPVVVAREPSPPATPVKRNKKAKAAAAAPEQDDDAGWSTVVDKKRVKRDERKEVKKREADVKKAEAELTVRLATGKAAAQKEKEKKLKEKEKASAKKKKAKLLPTHVTVTSEAQMVDVVTRLIENGSPDGFLYLSSLSDKLKSVTKHSWNDKFRREFGLNMKQFLTKHATAFHVAEQDKIYTLKSWKFGPGRPKQKKEVKADGSSSSSGSSRSSGATGSKTGRRTGSSRNGNGDDDGDDVIVDPMENSLWARLLFAMIILALTALLAMLTLEHGTMARIVEKGRILIMTGKFDANT